MTAVAHVALIGCGRIAGHHCRAILQTPGVQLVAVCDLAHEKTETWTKEFGVPGYNDYRAMLAKHPEIDTVAVITPSGMHFEHSLEILRDHRKNLIVEKPTFMKPSQMREAYQLADKVGVRIFPVFQNRHNKAVQRVRKGLMSGELGDVRLVSVRVRWCRPQRYYDLAPWRGTYAMDGGALTNQGVHHLDLLRYLGGEVKRVTSTMRTLGAKIEVEDTVVGSLVFANGAVGTLEVTTAARPDDFEASISFVCEKGLAQIGGIAVNELQIYTPDPSACQQESEDFSKNVYGNGHLKMYQEIAQDLASGKKYSVTREDGTGTLQLLHAFYRSDEQESRWVDVAVLEESTRLGRADENLANLYRTEFALRGHK